MNSKPLNDDRIVDEGCKLIIFGAAVGDEGVYECIATNVAGKTKRATRLVVSIPPNFGENNRENIETLKDQNIALNCSVKSHPNAKFEWTKNG